MNWVSAWFIVRMVLIEAFGELLKHDVKFLHDNNDKRIYSFTTNTFQKMYEVAVCDFREGALHSRPCQSWSILCVDAHRKKRRNRMAGAVATSTECQYSPMLLEINIPGESGGDHPLKYLYEMCAKRKYCTEYLNNLETPGYLLMLFQHKAASLRRYLSPDRCGR